MLIELKILAILVLSMVITAIVGVTIESTAPERQVGTRFCIILASQAILTVVWGAIMILLT